MRFCSTPESAREGEITVLGLLETLLAVALSLLLVPLLHTSVHIIAGAFLAPFLFLRTESSTTRAFVMFDACLGRMAKLVAYFQGCYAEAPGAKRGFLRTCAFLLIWLPLFSLLAMVIKMVATIQTLFAAPRETLRAIPDNWLRVALAIDHRHPPELLPGLESAAEAPGSLQTIRYQELRRVIVAGAGGLFAQKVCLFAIYCPTLLYRLFLKSASLIYFPLVWISNVPLTPKGVLSFPLERVRRWYAGALVLLMLLTPLLIAFPAQQRLFNPRDQAIFTYVLPVHMTDWWHLARIVAVAVTVALYFYARQVEQDDAPNPQLERLIIARANYVRAACAVLTMGYFLLIVLIL